MIISRQRLLELAQTCIEAQEFTNEFADYYDHIWPQPSNTEQVRQEIWEYSVGKRTIELPAWTDDITDTTFAVVVLMYLIRVKRIYSNAARLKTVNRLWKIFDNMNDEHGSEFSRKLPK